MASENFEQVVTAAQADGSLTPAWKKFVNTKFFVAIVRSADDDPKNFTLHQQLADGKPAVTISEVRERIPAAPGSTLVAISGAEVVRRLHADCAILVALSDRVFSIAKERVLWLRNGIEQAQARAAEKARKLASSASPAKPASPAKLAFPPLDAAPADAPAPAPRAPAVVLDKPTAIPAPAPSTPVTRNQVGVLDVPALAPRPVSLSKIGLEFFVPGSWTESASASGLRFHGAAHASTVEATGMHRPQVSLAQWVEMRQALVAQEMRYLAQDGAAYPFEGDSWRGRIKGMATEYSGVFPGDAGPSRYLLACIWTDGVLATITIKAPADAFERNRALYKWLLSRVEMQASAAAVYSPPASETVSWGDTETAPMFGFSLAGRMGRLRALAYTFPMLLALAVVGIVAAVLIPVNRIMGGIIGVAGVGVVCWFSLRLMVLRLHDVNLSGKWLLGFMVAIALAVLTKNVMFLLVASIILWVGSLIIYCFIPGTTGENDYGDPPGPNTLLVKIGALAFIVLQLGQIGAASRYSKEFDRGLSLPGFAPSGAAPASAPAGLAFAPPDSIFSVTLPGTPEEVELPPAMLAQLDGITMRQYQLVAHGHVYMLQAIDYLDRMPDNRFDAMDGMQDSFVGRDGTLIEASPIRMNGATGRQVKVSLPGGRLRAARFAVVGSKFCMASITVQNAATAAPAVDAFLASFQLHPD